MSRIHVREHAPFFKCEAVVGGSFEELSLDYYMYKGHWLILMFIPMAFSFVCPTEVLAFSEMADEFTAADASIAFVSTDSKYSLWTWQAKSKAEGGLGKINIPLLSDQSHRMCRDYGVLIESEGVALRGMFIIDPKGIVRQVTINDLNVGRSVLEALRLLEAFKHTEKHGVVCPANWGPGEAAIHPTIGGKEVGLKGQRLDQMVKKNKDKESPTATESTETQSTETPVFPVRSPTSDPNMIPPSPAPSNSSHSGSKGGARHLRAVSETSGAPLAQAFAKLGTSFSRLNSPLPSPSISESSENRAKRGPSGLSKDAGYFDYNLEYEA